MVKLFSVLQLRPGIDPVTAQKYWREDYVKWEKQCFLPDLKKYTINRVIDKYPGAGGRGGDFDIFGYSICWFEDLEAALRAMKRLQNAQSNEFLTKYVTMQRVVTESKPIPVP